MNGYFWLLKKEIRESWTPLFIILFLMLGGSLFIRYCMFASEVPETQRYEFLGNYNIFLIGLLTVFLACASFSRDVEKGTIIFLRQIPVSPLTIAQAKFSAILLFDLIALIFHILLFWLLFNRFPLHGQSWLWFALLLPNTFFLPTTISLLTQKTNDSGGVFFVISFFSFIGYLYLFFWCPEFFFPVFYFLQFVWMAGCSILIYQNIPIWLHPLENSEKIFTENKDNQ